MSFGIKTLPKTRAQDRDSLTVKNRNTRPRIRPFKIELKCSQEPETLFSRLQMTWFV